MHCKTDTQCLRLNMSDGKELARSQQVILHQDLISMEKPSALVFVEMLQRCQKE